VTTEVRATTEVPTTDAPVVNDAPATTVAPPAGPMVVDVTARDFGFEGLPTELAAGSYEFHFRNTGAELHELVIFRNLEGLSLEELHALGPQGVVEKVELVGIVFADPGQPAPDVIVADLAPGEYEVVCFIPTPTDGQPHFAHGMHAVITVA
jgi:hypothetical protein